MPSVERSLEDWQAARPPRIRHALEKALSRPTGNWYVLDATNAITEKPTLHVINGLELVAWRADGIVRVAPNECPHMGASLAEGCVLDGQLVCPWHGLRLGAEGHGAWRPFATHDDGILTWLRLGPANPAVPQPVIAPRPQHFIPAIVSMQLRCQPADVIANRLDPWHGAWLHDYTFASLRVLSHDDDMMRVRVAVRVVGPVCVECDCTFHSPEPRTIVMTILDGEGAGTVVETHATPIGPNETRLLELTLAASQRPGFKHVVKMGRLLSPLIARAARRLWDDDAPYAERLHQLRERALTRDNEAYREMLRGTPQK